MTLATATEFCKLKRVFDVPLSVCRESQLTLVLLWRLAKKQAADLGCRFPRGWKAVCSLEAHRPWEPKTVVFSRVLLGETGVGALRFMLAQIAIAVAKETGARPSVVGEKIGVLLHDSVLKD